jgi:hypothetical protein
MSEYYGDMTATGDIARAPREVHFIPAAREEE